MKNEVVGLLQHLDVDNIGRMNVNLFCNIVMPQQTEAAIISRIKLLIGKISGGETPS